MEIILNGERKNLLSTMDIHALLKVFKINSEGTVILLNGEVISSENYTTTIKEENEIEILRFVSGG